MDQPRKPDDTDTTLGGDATRFVSDTEVQKLRAAQTAGASLVIISGDEIGREFSLDAPETVIGRGDDVTIRVYSRSVSRYHAKVTRAAAGDRYDIVDLGSMNGTAVNGAAVDAPVALRHNDKVEVGDVVFKFVMQDAYDAWFHREVHRLIHYDQLTGLMTMESFRRVLDEALRDGKPDQPFTLSMTDLDGLKRVNDSHGHLAGRMVVGAMGGMMREAIRPKDYAGLYGGDEAIVLYTAAPLAEAAAIADGLRTAIERRVFTHEGQSFGVTISQGLAEWPRHGATAEALIAAADRALYQAKADGRNCVRTAND